MLSSPQALYNIGRGYHQLGIRNLAEHYYLLALAASSREGENSGTMNAASFNLVTLYKQVSIGTFKILSFFELARLQCTNDYVIFHHQSGATAKARAYFKKYLKISR